MFSTLSSSVWKQSKWMTFNQYNVWETRPRFYPVSRSLSVARAKASMTRRKSFITSTPDVTLQKQVRESENLSLIWEIRLNAFRCQNLQVKKQINYWPPFPRTSGSWIWTWKLGIFQLSYNPWPQNNLRPRTYLNEAPYHSPLNGLAPRFTRKCQTSRKKLACFWKTTLS